MDESGLRAWDTRNQAKKSHMDKLAEDVLQSLEGREVAFARHACLDGHGCCKHATQIQEMMLKQRTLYWT